MKQFNNETIQKGFTLLEVIIAIFILTVGIAGAYTLITQTISSAAISEERLIAAYLAQEGIEIGRNIRDGNWLEGATWNTGLTGCSTGCEADFDDSSLVASASRYLKIDGGFYNYDSGTNTKFKRKITIIPEGTDILKVSVLVEWQERGRTHQLSAQENLYNWR